MSLAPPPLPWCGMVPPKRVARYNRLAPGNIPCWRLDDQLGCTTGRWTSMGSFFVTLIRSKTSCIERTSVCARGGMPAAGSKQMQQGASLVACSLHLVPCILHLVLLSPGCANTSCSHPKRAFRCAASCWKVSSSLSCHI